MSPDKKTFTTVEQGVEHIDLYKWSNLDVTAEKLYNLRANGYAAGLSTKRHNMILSTEDGKPWQIEVLDPESEIDEDLQTTLERMFTVPKVDYWSKLHMAFDDTDWYGKSTQNPVWEKVNGEIVLTRLRHLPAHTLDTLPPGRKLYAQILQGITKDPETGEVEYWQRPDSAIKTPKKLDSNSLFTIQNPTSGELAGEPFMLPLTPFFSMTEYGWNGELQLVHRIGVPTVIPKLTGPAQPASPENGNKGDIEYLEDMAMYRSKDNIFPLRENMDMKVIEYGGRDVIGEALDRLHMFIIEYSSPSSFVSKDGTLIGGSDKSAGNLMNMYINGTRTWLAGAFNQLLQYYLDANGFEGYKAYFKVPLLSEDQADVRLKEAALGYQAGVLDFNEIRERLRAEGLDEESIQKIIEFYKTFKPAPPAPGYTAQTMTTLPLANAPGGTLSGASGRLVEDTYNDLSKSLKTLEDDILNALETEGVEGHVHGGEGSGNFGHEGRPGEVGGSGPGGEGYRNYKDAGLSDRQVKSIEIYTSPSSDNYERINGYIREGKVGSGEDPELDGIINDIDSSFTETVPDGETLYKGQPEAIYSGLGKTQSKELLTANAGYQFEDKDYQSFSTDYDTADNFAKTVKSQVGDAAVILKYEGDGKTKCIKIGGEEGEVLLPRGKTFEVTGTEVKYGGHRLVKIVSVKLAGGTA